MKVIFIQNVAKVGKMGEVKEVATGYAMNVLLPKKYAVLATDAEIKKITQEKKTKENKKTLEKNLFLQAIKSLEESISPLPSGRGGDGTGFLEIIGHKHEGGKLFSAVSQDDIVNAIYNKIKISFNPSQVIMPKENIKSHGEYEIELKDHENKRKIKILVK
jgi:large subunit ribosomal protein L9